MRGIMKTALVLILLCTAFFSGVAANRYFIGKNPGATQTNAQSAAEEPGLMRVAGGQGTEQGKRSAGRGHVRIGAS